MNKKKIITGIFMAAIFVMLAFVPAANAMHTAQANATTTQQGTVLNNENTTHLILNHTTMTINTVKLKDGFMISSFINGSLSSWVIYQNNIQAGRVSIMAFSDGNLSFYSHNVNESNMTGAVNTSNITNHTQASIAATYTPGDAKYSTGLYGWAISFSPGEIFTLEVALGAGATITGIISIIAAMTVVGAPVAIVAGAAAVIMTLGVLGLTILAHNCDNGAYIGTSWIELPVHGCNPVPWGY